MYSHASDGLARGPGRRFATVWRVLAIGACRLGSNASKLMGLRRPRRVGARLWSLAALLVLGIAVAPAAAQTRHNTQGTAILMGVTFTGTQGAAGSTLNWTSADYTSTTEPVYDVDDDGRLNAGTDYWGTSSGLQHTYTGYTFIHNGRKYGIYRRGTNSYRVAVEGSIRASVLAIVPAAGTSRPYEAETGNVYPLAESFALVSLSVVGDPTVNEGKDAVFSLNLSASSNARVELPVVVSPSGNVVAPSVETVAVPAGATAATFRIRTINDNTDEEDGGVIATLGDMRPLGYRAGPMRRAVVGVRDGEDPPHIAALEGATAGEGDDVVFIVRLSPASGPPNGAVSEKTVTVDYNTTVAPDDTAVAGTDFTAVAGTLTFAPGNVEQRVRVSTTADDDLDLETFSLELSNPTQASLSGGVATLTVKGTIAELPSVSIEADASRVEEGADAVFTVAVSLVGEDDLVVPLTVSQSGNVTLFRGGRVTIPGGQTSVKFTVPTVNDNVDEGDGRITVSIGDLPMSHILDGAAASAVVRVGDNDNPPILSVSDARAVDLGTAIRFTVRLAPARGSGRPSDYAVTVDYTTVDGSATSPTHYYAASGNVTFMPGETEKHIVIEVNPAEDGNDTAETFALVLSSPQRAVFAGGGAELAATGHIIEGLDARQLRRIETAAAPQVAAAITHASARILHQRVHATFDGNRGAGLSLQGSGLAGYLAAQEGRHRRGEAARLERFNLGLTADGEARSGLELGLWMQRFRENLEFNVGETRFKGGVDGSMAGVDSLVGRDVLLGVAISRAEGDLRYRMDHEFVRGDHKTYLRGVRPYFAMQTDNGSRFWGAFGLDRGETKIVARYEGAPPLRYAPREVELHSFWLGGYGALASSVGRRGGTRLGLVGDRVWSVFKDIDDDTLTVKTGRLRFGVEVDYHHVMPDGAAYGSRWALIGRRDIGDGAFSGDGTELEGGLNYSLGPLRAALDARTLMAHDHEAEANDDRANEWSAAATLAWSSDDHDGRGLSLAFSPQWGGWTGPGRRLGPDSLARADLLSGFGQAGADAYRMELKYGFGLAREAALLTLFVRDANSHAAALGADYRLGEAFTAGYEAVIERAADHRGYIRYRLRF